MKIRVLSIVMAVFFGLVGCAEGGLTEIENQGGWVNQGDGAGGDGSSGDTGDGAPGDQDTGDGDGAAGDGDGSTGDGSTGDGSTGDGSAGDGSAGDGSAGDGSTGDGSTGDGESCSGCADGVCDPDTGDCVECLVNEDCSVGLVCDSASKTCTQCSQNSDCPGGAKCHDLFPVCVAECCSFAASHAFTNTGYIHNYFDIAVTGSGVPFIVFADPGSNELKLAQRVGNNWFSQVFGTFSGGSAPNIRLALDHGGNPHVVTRQFSQWHYFWRDGDGTWHQDEPWDTQPGGGSYTDIQVGVDGTVHLVANDWEDILYARRAPGGAWTREVVQVNQGQNVVWLALGLKSNGEPVIAATVFNSPTWAIWVAERSNQSWSDALAVGNSTQVQHMVVGPGDELVIVYHHADSPHDGVRLARNDGAGWQEEVVASIAQAGTLFLDVDSRGDAHITYSVNQSSTQSYLGYTRWDGDSWESHAVSQDLVGRAFWQRLAVDESYVAHIAVYDSANSTLSYVRTDHL